MKDMFDHEDVWRAIDLLARKNGLSTSALAKRAGLDATSFNKSKRITRGGRARWPSSESLAKVLHCTNTPLEEFVVLMTGRKAAAGATDGGRDGGHDGGRDHHGRRLPLIGLVRAGDGGYFDDAGFPVGAGWDEVDCPGVADENAYALRITGDSMEPVYREGDVIIVSPGSSVRRGDRVVVRLRTGEVMAKLLVRRTAEFIELASFNPAWPPRRMPRQAVAWMARIIWASQ